MLTFMFKYDYKGVLCSNVPTLSVGLVPVIHGIYIFQSPTAQYILQQHRQHAGTKVSATQIHTAGQRLGMYIYVTYSSYI